MPDPFELGIRRRFAIEGILNDVEFYIATMAGAVSTKTLLPVDGPANVKHRFVTALQCVDYRRFHC